MNPTWAPRWIQEGGPRRVRESTFGALGGPGVLWGPDTPLEPPKASQTMICYDLGLDCLSIFGMIFWYIVVLILLLLHVTTTCTYHCLQLLYVILQHSGKARWRGCRKQLDNRKLVKICPGLPGTIFKRVFHQLSLPLGAAFGRPSLC